MIQIKIWCLSHKVFANLLLSRKTSLADSATISKTHFLLWRHIDRSSVQRSFGSISHSKTPNTRVVNCPSLLYLKAQKCLSLQTVTLFFARTLEILKDPARYFQDQKGAICFKEIINLKILSDLKVISSSTSNPPASAELPDSYFSPLLQIFAWKRGQHFSTERGSIWLLFYWDHQKKKRSKKIRNIRQIGFVKLSKIHHRSCTTSGFGEFELRPKKI